MFSHFSESGIQGIEIKSTGQRWYLEEPEEVQAFVDWLNHNASQSDSTRKASLPDGSLVVWHLFFVNSNGEAKALVEKENGSVVEVYATWVSFSP